MALRCLAITADELVSTIMLPSLELVAVPGTISNYAATTIETCVHTPIKLKCPNLKEAILYCRSGYDIDLLDNLLSGAPKLETVQVAVYWWRTITRLDFSSTCGGPLREAAASAI
ncbi:hypothetical protein COCOBI_18-2460 [Coccomyxa sp. Obi]|nr:hypothetical protein COCOBI_18-2460 [Coccomyxa sp. Obi]